MQVRAKYLAADQGHGAAQLRQLGGGLDAGRTGSDNRQWAVVGAASTTGRSRSASSRLAIG